MVVNKVETGVYRHFKGGMYVVLFVARSTDDLSDTVVYRSLKDDSIWVRPLPEFMEIIKDGTPRFKKI